MTRRLAIGIGRDGDPVHLDLDFLDGTKGGHVSISGISGVATKTSTALALIRLLLAHDDMRRRVRVLLFNVKGEDLLFIDHPNATYRAAADRDDLDDRWGAPGPGPARGLPRRRVLGAAARRRPPHAQQRVAPRGREGLRVDAPPLRRRGAAALLLLGRLGHAQPAELPGGAGARRAAAPGGAGAGPPRRAGPAGRARRRGARQAPAEPGRRARRRPLPRPRGPGGLAGRRAGRRGRRRPLDPPRRPRAR